ncbi:MAG: DUF4421 family protein [Bacteroidota bacterium]|nr:DUF4421 family protein [Bacteroidota bacterium]MDP3146350.1 DUF4421 family protein [Bacteroidota bacterium]MDP3556358.1 DUF4421 family protein [Bacteroidota bacterium]
MHRYLFFFLVLSSLSGRTQNTSETKVSIEKKRKNWDTLKYEKFERVFIVGLFQQYRNFSNEFKQLINNDSLGISNNTYFAESQLIGGIVLNYDKFSLSLGTRTQPQEFNTGKGHTKTFNIGFNVGDNRWVSENYYRRFEGFYNKSTQNFDTAFKRTGNYYLQPGLKSSLLSSRFMYFSHYDRFSFKSGFGCNYRQLKSAASWIIGGSFNVYTLNNDSSIFPIQSRKYYNDYANLKGFQSVNISGAFGGAATLVIFKALFISGYFTVGPEQQWRSYNLGDNYRNLSYMSWSGTGRFSMGLNMRRFYLLVSNSNDYNLYNSAKIMSLKSESITHNFTFGWRFYKETPKFYEKFMKSKFYSFL